MEGSVQDKDVVVALAAAVLEDMLEYFLPGQRPWCIYGRTWIIIQLVREVWSWMDYILGTDHRLFRNVSIRVQGTTQIIT